MKVLLVGDAFPPRAGGSGWSTHALARALRARGHAVSIVQPRVSTGGAERRSFDGFDVLEPIFRSPPVPFVRNYFRNERLYVALGDMLAAIIRRERFDVVHGQHQLSGPAATRAAATAGIVSVCTIRDYWPTCYWSDQMLDPARGVVCPECSAGNMTTCLRPRGGVLWPLGLAAIPYMTANLAGKQRALAAAHAVVCVSRHVAEDLRRRAPALRGSRVEVIPNAVDVDALLNESSEPPPVASPYALYVGKLESNKGSHLALEAVAAADVVVPLVVVGDGAMRRRLEAQATALHLDVRFMGWRDRPTVLGWMRHATALVFPSSWPEPFSRVLLEAAALGVPIAAMDTGGTREIVLDGETGLLCRGVRELATAVTRLITDSSLRRRLADGARRHARSSFDAATVATRTESLYAELLSSR